MKSLVCMLLMGSVTTGASAAEWTQSVSLGRANQADTEFDDGGDFHASRTKVDLGTAGMLGSSVHASFSVQHEHIDYEFSDDAVLGPEPWNDVQQTALSAQLVYPARARFSYIVASSVGLSRENGAENSDSMTYGGMFGVIRNFAPDRQLGFGVAFRQSPELSRALPVLIVDWKLTERLHLGNSGAASPAGSGFQLTYQLSSPWVLGAGLGFRNDRFRLNETASGDLGGVVEERGGTVFLHAGRRVGSVLSFGLYAGTSFAGEMRLEDSAGNGLIEQDLDPAPFIGATFTAQF
jgi:hypothetical protein